MGISALVTSLLGMPSGTPFRVLISLSWPWFGGIHRRPGSLISGLKTRTMNETRDERRADRRCTISAPCRRLLRDGTCHLSVDLEKRRDGAGIAATHPALCRHVEPANQPACRLDPPVRYFHTVSQVNRTDIEIGLRMEAKVRKRREVRPVGGAPRHSPGRTGRPPTAASINPMLLGNTPSTIPDSAATSRCMANWLITATCVGKLTWKRTPCEITPSRFSRADA